MYIFKIQMEQWAKYYKQAKQIAQGYTISKWIGQDSKPV